MPWPQDMPMDHKSWPPWATDGPRAGARRFLGNSTFCLCAVAQLPINDPAASYYEGKHALQFRIP